MQSDNKLTDEKRQEMDEIRSQTVLGLRAMLRDANARAEAELNKNLMFRNTASGRQISTAPCETLLSACPGDCVSWSYVDEIGSGCSQLRQYGFVRRLCLLLYARGPFCMMLC